MKNIKTLTLIVLTSSCFNSFGQDMSGPPAKKKVKSKSEITSPTKQQYSEVQKNIKIKLFFQMLKSVKQMQIHLLL